MYKNLRRLKKKQNANKGITLIALVITIIVLLILAAVSIATLTGENGILTKASDAKTQTQIAEIKELAKTDIVGIQAENESGNITKDQLKTVLEKYFKDVPEELPEDTTSLELTVKEEYGKHKIKVSDIWNGNFTIEDTSIEFYLAYSTDGEETFITLKLDTEMTWAEMLSKDLEQLFPNLEEGMRGDLSYFHASGENRLSFFYQMQTIYLDEQEPDGTLKAVYGKDKIKAGGYYVMG